MKKVRARKLKNTNDLSDKYVREIFKLKYRLELYYIKCKTNPYLVNLLCANSCSLFN